ncbi:hypothetical protein Tco_0267201 [Tanacetum coccineum]
MKPWDLSFTLQLKDVQINPVQAVDASLVVTESSRIELENNSSENALNKSVNETQMQMQEGKVDMGKALDVGPVNDQEPLTEVQLTAQHNVLANEQQHTE